MPAEKNRQYTIRKTGNGYMHFIELTSADVKKLTAGGNKRVICTLDKRVTLHAAVMKTKEGMYYIMIANKYLKQLSLRLGGTVSAVFKKDDSALQFPVSEELTEVLATDEKARKIFEGLTPGNKRGLAALVNMVKSTDKKIERALKIAEKLKQGITSPQQVMKRN